MGDLSILPHLCIYSIVCLYQYEFMDIYFILWIIINIVLLFLLLRSSSCIFPAPLVELSFSKKP